MSSEQTDAIVLRVYPWSETSCVATLYTRDFGKLSVIAKGARRPKSPFEAALDLLSICRVVFIDKSSDALDILTEAKLRRRFRAGSRDLLRLYCGYYLIELLDRFTDLDDKQAELFELSLASLDALEDPKTEPRAIMLRFEFQLLRLIGNLPSWQRCVTCGQNVAPAEWMTFSVTSGGVLCDACRHTARNRIRLSRGAYDTLRIYSDRNWQTMDVSTFPQQDRTAIRGLVTRYLTATLGRRLQLHDFLEELGR